MSAPPINPATDRTATAVTKCVTLSDLGTPTDDHENPGLQPVDIVRSAGGKRLDYATMKLDLGRTGLRVRNLQTPASWLQQVIVKSVGEDDDPGTPLFFGDLVEQEVRLASLEESAKVTAKLEPYHFGAPLRGYSVWNPITEEVAIVEEDPIFNPRIDDRIEGNMSSKMHPDSDTPLWIDPESVRTEEGETYQAATASEWGLAEAVQSLCALLNQDEEYVENPDVGTGIFVGATAPDNLRLRRGRYLPELLDALLIPAGFNWYVEVEEDEDGGIVRKIVPFTIGMGESREIFWQDVAQSFDPAKHNVGQFSLTTNVADLANKVILQADREEIEVTLPLYPAWPQEDDGVTADRLDRSDVEIDDDDSPGANTSEYSAKPDVWRLYLANEAGDATARRPTGPNAMPADPPDLTPHLRTYVPKRRRLERPLSTDASGKRLNIRVDYKDTSGDLPVWKPVPREWGYTVLTEQIGIRFTGKRPPEDLIKLGVETQLRITGTICGDSRLTTTQSDLTKSPSGREITMLLDVADRYHSRKRVNELFGDYDSVLTAEPADEIDDTSALATFAERILVDERSAVMAASIVLHGLHFDYRIGDIIQKVAGREISLSRDSEDVQGERYMQVVGLHFRPQQQTTALIVEPATPPRIE